MKKRIYLDNTFATKIDNDVKKTMLEYTDFFSESNAMYEESRVNRTIISKFYDNISKIINSKTNENFFINSEIQFYNLILLGVIKQYQDKGKHIITTKIENYKQLKLFKYLEEKENFKITYLNTDKDGLINISDFKKALSEDTIFISIGYANEEIGTIQPIKEISKIIKEFKKNHNTSIPIFYSDLSSIFNYSKINIKDIGLNLATFFSYKFYGPRDIGIFYKEDFIKIQNPIIQHEQELYSFSNNRSIALMSGFVKSLEKTEKIKVKERERILKLREYFIKKIKNKIKKIHILGSKTNFLPNHINLSIEGIEGEAIVLTLDNDNISVSTGSACSAIDLDGSHVLEAIKTPIIIAHGSIRISFGRDTTKEDLDYVIEKLITTTEKLRAFSAIKI